MVAGIQGSRMNDQRAVLPEFPGLNNRDAVIGQFINRREDSQPDDGFFEMLMRCQVRVLFRSP
jgi:G-protein signaling modulator 2